MTGKERGEREGLLDPKHRRVDSVAEKEGKGEVEPDPRRRKSKKRHRKVKKRHKGSEKVEPSLESEGEENNLSDSDILAAVEIVVAAMKDLVRSWRIRVSSHSACSDRNLAQKVEVKASTAILLRRFLHDVHSTYSIPTRSLSMDSAYLPQLITLRCFSRMLNLLNWVE